MSNFTEEINRFLKLLMCKSFTTRCQWISGFLLYYPSQFKCITIAKMAAVWQKCFNLQNSLSQPVCFYYCLYWNLQIFPICGRLSVHCLPQLLMLGEKSLHSLLWSHQSELIQVIDTSHFWLMTTILWWVVEDMLNFSVWKRCFFVAAIFVSCG